MSGLQKINFSQIDTENLPSGLTINMGSTTDPINKIVSNQFKTPSGTSTEFLMADGSVDGNTYSTVELLSGETFNRITGDTGLYYEITGLTNLLINKTIILQSSGWTSNTITVTASGATSTNSITISAPTDRSQYLSYGASNISCTGQGSNTLSFVCDITPNNDITLNIKIDNN